MRIKESGFIGAILGPWFGSQLFSGGDALSNDFRRAQDSDVPNSSQIPLLGEATADLQGQTKFPVHSTAGYEARLNLSNQRSLVPSLGSVLIRRAEHRQLFHKEAPAFPLDAFSLLPAVTALLNAL